MNGWNGNDAVFRYYSRGEGKGGKGKKQLSFSEAAEFESFGGYLKEGFVDISFDSPEESDSFWKMSEENNWDCLILENPTTKHIHSIWKDSQKRIEKDGQKLTLAVGLKADIHSQYTPLRVEGVDRFPPSYEPDEIQEVPEELLPVKTNITLFGLGEGDGRNDAVYRSILVLQQYFPDMETVKRILTNTNDYLFKEPLSDDELQTVLRDGAFQKPSFFGGKNKSFLHNVFGDYLIRTYHIKMIDGSVKVYQDGIYNPNQRAVERIMLKEIPMLKSTQRNETLGYLNVMCDEANLSPSTMIAFRNGILNVETGEMLEFSPDYILTNKIPWDYNPNAADSEAEAFLNRITCNDPGIRSILEESIGYCFYRDNFLQKAFFLTGTGANGKSTFLKVLNCILGKENVSHIDLKNLNDRFMKIQLVGKLANIGDDIGDEPIDEDGFFKKVNGENRTVEVEKKGKDAFDAEINCKFFFSANQMPRMGKSDRFAILRRLILIPFQARFEETEPEFDPHITSKLTTQPAIEYFIKVGIQGLKRLLQNRRFTESEKANQAKRDYEDELDSVKAFINENGREVLFSGSVKEVYLNYADWCMDNDLQVEKKATFGKRVKEKYHVDSKPMRKCNGRVYIDLLET